MCRKDLIGSKVFFDILFSGFVPFLSRQTKDGKRQTTEVIDKECVTRGQKDENAVTTRKETFYGKAFKSIGKGVLDS